MGLESTSFLDGLNVSWPDGGTDGVADGDNHLRLIKSTLKATFPGMAGRAWRFQTKSANYGLAATDNMSVIYATSAIAVTGVAATLGDGFIVLVVNASAGVVTVDGLSLNATEAAILVSSGSALSKFGIYTRVIPVNNNIIINGSFDIWQRGATFTGPTNAYIADRFKYQSSIDGVVDVTRAADAPTMSQAGVIAEYCPAVTVTTADASIAAGQYSRIIYNVEGLDAAQFGFGFAGASPVTLSFWVKSPKTGTFCVALQNSAANRSYVAEYVVSSANTWERKTVTIPGDVTGTWLLASHVGIRVIFTIVAGSTYQTTANTWAAGEYFATSSQTNTTLDTISNTFRITLVKLEGGSVATPFVRRSIAEELALCRRYYEKSYDIDVAPAALNALGSVQFVDPVNGGYFPIRFSVIKRATPVVTFYSVLDGASGQSYDVNSNVNVATAATIIGLSGATLSLANHGAADETIRAQWTADAEF